LVAGHGAVEDAVELCFDLRAGWCFEHKSRVSCA
jgi:hypothetical protein